MAVDIYTRRVSKQQFDNGWFDTEFGNIQRAFNTLVAPSTITESNISLSDVLTDDVTIARHGFAPKLPNDATKFLNGVGGYSVPTLQGTVTQAARLTSDQSTAAGVFISSLLTRPVLIGESWSIRWTLWIGSNVAATHGMAMQIVYPAASQAHAFQFGERTQGAFTLQSIAANTSPFAFSSAMAQFDSSALDAIVTVEASFYNFTANGTVDLQFKNVGGGGETEIIRAGSTQISVKTG